MARVPMWDGGTRKQIAACGGLGWHPSEWCNACVSYSERNIRRDYVVDKAFDFGSDYMKGAMKWANDPSGMWPAANQISSHILAAYSLVKNIVVLNCLSVDLKVEISVVSTFGNAPTVAAGADSADSVTDAAMKNTAGASCDTECYPGSLVTTTVVGEADLSKLGAFRFPTDLFLQDEGLVVLTLKPGTGTVVGAGCFSVMVDLMHYGKECDCACPQTPCDTTYPPAIECFPNT